MDYPHPSVDPLIADQALVRTLFYNASHVAPGSFAARATFMSNAQLPGLSLQPTECLANVRNLGHADSQTTDYIPDVSAIDLDPGWALPATVGRYAGMVPTGRIYISLVQQTDTDLNDNYNQTRTDQVHVAIVGGAAYFFQSCE